MKNRYIWKPREFIYSAIASRLLVPGLCLLAENLRDCGVPLFLVLCTDAHHAAVRRTAQQYCSSTPMALSSGIDPRSGVTELRYCYSIIP